MKIFRVVLIIASIAMLFVKGAPVHIQKKVFEAGAADIAQKETQLIAWGSYAGILVFMVGVLFFVAEKETFSNKIKVFRSGVSK
jgi:hypothetical protein